MTNPIVLLALAVAATSLSAEPSHAKRIRLSFPAAKAAPVAAAKPAPVAAAARKDNTVTRSHLIVTPGIAIRPSNSSASTATPAAFSAPMPDNDLAFGGAASFEHIPPVQPEKTTPAAAAAAAEETSKPAKSPAPAPKRVVELNAVPAQPQFVTPPAPARPAVLCFKTADGRCGRFE